MTGVTFSLTPQTVTNLIDIGGVVLVILCAAIGAQRGMIRMISGLAVLILALIGATFAASSFADPVTDWVIPKIESRVAQSLEESMSQENMSALIGGYAGAQDGETLEDTFDKTSFKSLRLDYLKELFSKLSEQSLIPETLTNAIEERLEEMRHSFTGTATQAIVAVLKDILRPVIYGLLYVVSFMVLSFVLKLVFHFADNVSEVPGLRSINATGGMILGLIQGLALLIAASFLLRYVFSTVDGVSDSRILKALTFWFPSLAFTA